MNRKLNGSQKVHLKVIIYYCLGSITFKKNNYINFINALNKLVYKDILFYLEKLHILALFYDAIKDIKDKNKYLRELKPFIYYQKQINKLFIEELKNLKKELNTSTTPIILKGPAFWGNIYQDNFLRRIDDLDILIVNEPQLEETCKVATRIGFKNVNPLYEKEIKSTQHYELSEFFKVVKLNNKKKYLEAVINRFHPPNLQKNNLNFSFYIRLEIHKLIYKFIKSPILPKIEKKSILDSNILPGYKVLPDFINLPYLSLKFISDSHAFFHGDYIKVKSLKLVADFVRMIQNVSQNEVEKSIIQSEKWGISKYYITMLNSVKDITPEIKFENLKTHENYLEKFIDYLMEIGNSEKIIN